MTTSGTWWGEVEIPRGKAGRFRVGPLELAVQHRKAEWRLMRRQRAEEDEVGVEAPVDIAEPYADATVTRYATSRPGDRVSVGPVLPDRAVVTKPEHPVTVPPRDEATIYVGSPLWVRVALVDPDTELEQMPCLPPISTWWGRDPTEGELCYATRTWGRLDADQVVIHPHRVATRVKILNRDATPLLFDRLYLPLSRLSIFADGAHLWTEDVTLEREAGEDATLVPDKAHKDMKRLAAPRNGSQHALFRAFGSLFR